MEIKEPASLDLGPFCIPDEAHAECISLSSTEATGTHTGFGFHVYRRLVINEEKVKVIDWHESKSNLIWKDPEPIKYSPRYGVKLTSLNYLQNAV